MSKRPHSLTEARQPQRQHRPQEARRPAGTEHQFASVSAVRPSPTLDWPSGPAALTRGASVHGAAGLAASPALARVLPGGGLRRGSSLGCAGGAGTSALVLALLAEPLARGAWGAVLGWPDLGVEAAAELGVPLARLALVPDPGTAWWEVAAVLVDTTDVVVLCPPSRPAPGLARRLASRTRERGALLIVAQPPRVGPRAAVARWPEPLDVVLHADAVRWHGLGSGYGRLASRELQVRSSGRRVPGGGDRARLVLPEASGPLAPVIAPGAPITVDAPVPAAACAVG